MQLGLLLDFQKYFVLGFPEGGLGRGLLLLVITTRLASDLHLTLLFLFRNRLLGNNFLRLGDQIAVVALVQH